MSDIHNLEIDVDLKENLIITATCKQLDDLNLIFNVWNNGEIANLTEYKCRLKAFKQDQIPLIQNTSININNNVVNIIADEQLTTTSGIVKVELQFISKNTGKKKSTFNIVFKVIQSVLEVERSISKATCTLLKEIDNKLDIIEDIGDVLEEAKDVRDTLINTTIPGATNINSKLESNIKNASDKIVEVESSITNASKKIEEVEASTKNANSSKEELDLSKTNADISKENLDAANVQAEKNIEELNKLGDVTDLAKNVQTNTTDITNLKEYVENNSSQLKDKANKIDVDALIFKSSFSKDTKIRSETNKVVLNNKDATEYISLVASGVVFMDEYSSIRRIEQDLYIKTGGELRLLTNNAAGVIVSNTDGNTYMPIVASAFNVSSKEEFKINIEEINADLDLLKNSKIYEYNLKEEEKNGIKQKHYGFVIDRETPKEILSLNRDSIDIYSLVSLLWRQNQELLDRIGILEDSVMELGSLLTRQEDVNNG